MDDEALDERSTLIDEMSLLAKINDRLRKRLDIIQQCATIMFADELILERYPNWWTVRLDGRELFSGDFDNALNVVAATLVGRGG